MAVNSMLFTDFQLHHTSFLGLAPVSGNPTVVLAHQQLVRINIFMSLTLGSANPKLTFSAIVSPPTRCAYHRERVYAGLGIVSHR